MYIGTVAHGNGGGFFFNFLFPALAAPKTCYLSGMSGNDLFSKATASKTETPMENATSQHQPLAARMRPRNLDEFAGQTHILGAGQLLRRAIEADRIQSLIFYGPPGTGKTSLAQI